MPSRSRHSTAKNVRPNETMSEKCAAAPGTVGDHEGVLRAGCGAAGERGGAADVLREEEPRHERDHDRRDENGEHRGARAVESDRRERDQQVDPDDRQDRVGDHAERVEERRRRALQGRQACQRCDPEQQHPDAARGPQPQPEQRDAAEGEHVVEREEREPAGAHQHVVRREDDGDRAGTHDPRSDAQQGPGVERGGLGAARCCAGGGYCGPPFALWERAGTPNLARPA